MANAIKWHDVSTSYDAVLEFCEGIRAYDPEVGMLPYQFVYTLRILKIPFKKRRSLTIQELDSVLDSGGSLILAYVTEKGTSHAVFIDARKPRRYRVWNRVKSWGPWWSYRTVKADIKRSLTRSGELYAFVFQALRPQQNALLIENKVVE